jgi:hypothetical protein
MQSIGESLYYVSCPALNNNNNNNNNFLNKSFVKYYVLSVISINFLASKPEAINISTIIEKVLYGHKYEQSFVSYFRARRRNVSINLQVRLLYVAVKFIFLSNTLIGKQL